MSMIQDVQTFLTLNLGWKIEIHEPTFEVKLRRVCKELGFSELNFCVKSLQNLEKNSKVLQAFAREYSVGETYFFRDLQFFEYFKNSMIPQIINKNERSLSIWSVGCSSGEELYSIAIMLLQMIPDIDTWDLYLLGTDVNPQSIDKARQGVFTQFSFRQMPEVYKSYFKEDNGIFEISQKIKNMVHFKYHNMMDEPYSCLPLNGNGFDLILLKNVLIYFDTKKAKTVVESLFNVLKEGGCLGTTPAEYSVTVFNFPHTKCSQDGYLIQKSAKPKENIFILPEEPKIIEMVIEDLVESEPQSKPEQPKVEQKDTQYSYYHNALERLKHEDNEGAKVFLRHALYLDRDLVMAHIVLANILKKEKKFETALKHVNNAKAKLRQMPPQEIVKLSGDITASDLLVMIDAIKGGTFE